MPSIRDPNAISSLGTNATSATSASSSPSAPSFSASNGTFSAGQNADRKLFVNIDAAKLEEFVRANSVSARHYQAMRASGNFSFQQPTTSTPQLIPPGAASSFSESNRISLRQRVTQSLGQHAQRALDKYTRYRLNPQELSDYKNKKFQDVSVRVDRANTTRIFYEKMNEYRSGQMRETDLNSNLMALLELAIDAEKCHRQSKSKRGFFRLFFSSAHSNFAVNFYNDVFRDRDLRKYILESQNPNLRNKLIELDNLMKNKDELGHALNLAIMRRT